MHYISFVVITDTPGRLRDFLINRNVLESAIDPISNTEYLVGTNPGMEWVNVPNPIQTAPANGVFGEVGYVPPTYDNRKVYLVKFAHESVNNEIDGPIAEANGQPTNIYDWSKFGKWVKTNSSVVNAPANYIINGGHAGEAYKINGELVWLIRDRPERFGVWQ